MKVLVFSDVHGRVSSAKKLDEIVRKGNFSLLLGLGDFLYNGPRNGVPEDYEPMEVSKILLGFNLPHIYVKGNCDSRVDDMVLYETLHDYRETDIDGHHYELYHGDDYSLAFLKKNEGNILVSGHTHIPVLKKEGGLTYLNPGSISFPKGGFPKTYMIIQDNIVTLYRLDDEVAIDSLIL